MPLLNDSRGPFLALSPAEASDVLAALVGAGIRFTVDDGSSAGCVGPEAVVVRFDEDTPPLRAAVRAALSGGPQSRS